MLSKLLVATSVTLLNAVSDDEEYVYQSSCRELKDGTHTLKLMDGDLEDAPLVEVECSNGYTILDISKDNDLEKYFDTFMKFHRSVAGPTNDVHTNWEGWYKPDDGHTNYVISPDCNVCEDNHQRQLYTEPTENTLKTVYMMTGTLFGCFWNLKGEHNFDNDYDSYQCYYSSGEINDVGESIRNELNDESSIEDWNDSGVCAFSVRESNIVLPSPMTHDACTVDFWNLNNNHDRSELYHLKPSIGTDGEYCICVKPSSTQYYTISSNEVNTHLQNKETIKTQTLEEKQIKIDTLTKSTIDDEYNLYQTDFIDGTYRILKSGTYKIMENIIFDFNADYDNPNSDTAWWPHIEQNEEYPGAGDYHDPYFLGFFAGITIEADDVIIDLNGYELRMSDNFYWQQRWFTIISLQSQYFLPGQGIGFFGANPHFAQNIEIKNGILGLTSHHGIHGHFNKNILINNLQIKEFETHGIQFNGFDGITIKNCEVGPTSEVSYFKGEYGHARTLLPRFQKVADENPSKLIHFYGREKPTTMQEIVDELQKQTDMAYNHVVNGVQYDDDDESWQSAQYLFLDKTNLPNGAAMYGIFLNTYGASVLTYNLYTSFYSSDATVIDTTIHGLKHSMNEYVRMSWPQSGNLFMNPLHAPFDASQILEQLEDFTPGNIKYKGSVLTDACLAMEKFTNNWNYLQAQLIMDNKMLSWAQKGGNSHGLDGIQVGCNIDVMIHSGKGINGLRIDGVDGVTISNIEMYDISEQTPLGRSECGEYDSYDGTGDCVGACGGHFRQTLPMQTGFSGTMVQGINVNAAKNVLIKDVSIHDIESHNGPVFGISIWPAVDIKFEGTINTKLLQAGTQIEKNTFTYESRPNIAPEGCGIRLYSEYSSNGFTYSTTVDTNNADSISSSCISSHVSCFDEENTYTHFGYFNENAECEFKTDSKLRDIFGIDNQENILTDPSMISHANMDTKHSMLFYLLIIGAFVAILSYFGYKCYIKSNKGKSLLNNNTTNQTPDEAHSLMADHDDGSKYTVL